MVWMNLASTCGGIQVGIPVIISKNKERFVEVPVYDRFGLGHL